MREQVSSSHSFLAISILQDSGGGGGGDFFFLLKPKLNHGSSSSGGGGGQLLCRISHGGGDRGRRGSEHPNMDNHDFDGFAGTGNLSLQVVSVDSRTAH